MNYYRILFLLSFLLLAISHTGVSGFNIRGLKQKSSKTKETKKAKKAKRKAKKAPKSQKKPKENSKKGKKNNTRTPSLAPTSMPSLKPSLAPSSKPSLNPSLAPTSSMPSLEPSLAPNVPPVSTCPYDTIDCDTDDGSCNRVDRSGVVSGPVGSTSCSDLTSAQLTSFTPIGGTAGSEILDISCAAHAFETVDLGFNFQWLGASNATLSSILVDTNGQINLYPADTTSNYCTYEELGENNYPRIAVAMGDYHPNTFGDIVVCKSTDSVVVSFEELDIFAANTKSSVNAQAQLFADGRVVICYGESLYGTTAGTSSCTSAIVSGIEGGINDPTYPSGPAVEYTVPDAVFGASSGAATVWPSEGCYLYSPGSAGFVAV